MLANHMEAELEAAIFSSWPLNKSTGLHPLHRGREMPTSGASVSTLDHFIENHALPRVDLIKIDVDGHESAVIKGSNNTLEKHAPTLVMEFAPYTLTEMGSSLPELLELLEPHGYNLFDEKTGAHLPCSLDALLASIPKGGSRNVIAARRSPFLNA